MLLISPSMLWAILLPLLSHCSGVSSQPALTQVRSESVALGKTVRLSARLSSGYESYYVAWYQQREGQAPRLLLYSDSTRASGIPDRFSGSRSGLDRYLTITGVQPEDEATYYCSTAYSSGSSYVVVFGGGTQVTVTGGPTVRPIVNLYPPSPDEIESKTTATVVCLIEGFSPSAFTVTWLGGGNAISKGVETTRATKVNDKYMASSYLSLTPEEWKSHSEVTCKVTHEGKNYEKSVSPAECP